MLKLIHVCKTFNRNTVNENKALLDLSLAVQDGDFVTVIGGNGSGKSTMLNAVAGVMPVDCGQIFIDEAEVTRLPEHKRAPYIGRVFQDPMMGTAAGMSIEENLALARRRGQRRSLRWGLPRHERDFYREKLKELDLGLEDRLSVKAGLLSGGQRQALTLLMATLQKPKLLLLDEHTAALDPKTASTVLDLTRKIVSQDAITTTHGNRLVMFHAGRVVIDVSGESKRQLTVEKLLAMFERIRDFEAFDDQLLLT